ncbi:MAG: integrin alpha, partial [Candidatus Sumerlaeia bacterium]|nr:integrin alpha [Candidatus Sumerlaeia bacterium]
MRRSMLELMSRSPLRSGVLAASFAMAAGIPGFVAGQNFDLSSLNGTNGFILNGPTANDFAGKTVRLIGDINGDGLSEALVTVPYNNPKGRTRAGEAYVIFGSAVWGTGLNDDPLSGGSTFNISGLQPSDGFLLQGATAEDFFGYTAGAIGDINGDGLADFAIAAPYGEVSTPNRDQGEIYVLFGNESWNTGGVDDPTAGTGVLDMAALPTGAGFVVRGQAAYDLLGSSIDGGMDVNGDGIDDMVFGTILASVPSRVRAGRAYVIFGDGLLGTGQLGDPLAGGTVWNNSRFNGDDGFVLYGGTTDARFGRSVAMIEDFDGDGFNDLAFGAPLHDQSDYNTGRVTILLGTNQFGTGSGTDPLAGGGVLDTLTLVEPYGFHIDGVLAGEQFGTVVSGGGDLNNDGEGDLLVGVPDGSNTSVSGDREGNVFVILGNVNYAT